jgi:hypothetical protein
MTLCLESRISRTPMPFPHNASEIIERWQRHHTASAHICSDDTTDTSRPELSASRIVRRQLSGKPPPTAAIPMTTVFAPAAAASPGASWGSCRSTAPGVNRSCAKQASGAQSRNPTQFWRIWGSPHRRRATGKVFRCGGWTWVDHLPANSATTSETASITAWGLSI